MKILITGSNGLLGQKLVKLCIEKGVEVIATSRGESRIDYLEGSFEYASLDITDQGSVNSVMNRYRPDVVVNTAAMTNVDQCETDREACRLLNVQAVQNLVDCCEAQNTLLVHLSTDFIFDGEAGPYEEDDQPNPISFYGQSKWDAENIIMESNAKWAILRTVLVFGITPGMSRSNIILWVKENLENGKPLNIVNDQWRTPTLAEDLAMGCFLAADQRAEGIFNISGEELLSPYEMAIHTADYFGLDKSLITEVDASTFSQTAKRPTKTGFILDKAKEVLGYQPHSFVEGIKHLDEQFKRYTP